MSRFTWLKNFEQHLKSGTKEDLEKDIEYCKYRIKIAKLKSHIKTWEQWIKLAENAIFDRF